MFIILDFSKAFRILAAFLLLLMIMILTTTAYAGSITRTKGKAVEITLDQGEDYVKGDTVYSYSSNGKKIGKITIVKIKNGKAIGKIAKGSAHQGNLVKMSQGKKGTDKSTDEEVESTSAGDKSKWRVGFVLGYASNSQTLKSTLGTLDMTGTSILYKAYADVPVSGSVGAIVRAGMDNFNVETTTANTGLCAGNPKCTTKISYFVGDFLIRYAFGSGTFMPFVHAGIGVMIPSSKSSNALDQAKLGMETPGYLGGGFYYQISPTLWIPATVELKIIMPNSQQNTMSIHGSTGVMFSF
jgi:hypothetical protein